MQKIAWTFSESLLIQCNCEWFSSHGQIQNHRTFSIDISHVFMFLALGKNASSVSPYFANTGFPRYWLQVPLKHFVV